MDSTTYRTPRKAKEQDKQPPQPISMIGAGRGGCLIAFSEGTMTATNGR